MNVWQKVQQVHEANGGNRHRRLFIEVYGYIEENYRDGGLTELARLLNYDVYWLSKEIMKRSGRNYTELVQEKRLRQLAARPARRFSGKFHLCGPVQKSRWQIRTLF